MERYEWPVVSEFVNRSSELERLEQWWASSSREPLNLYGRRRVGKSWLFRRFAHEKPALILVADRLAVVDQLARFAGPLEALVGVRPELSDVATLFRVLLRATVSQKMLVVIDEFPYLLGTTAAEADAVLSSIQAVLEESLDSSRIKLILCGSAVAQMEKLQSEGNPLHGRLVPLELRPLPFTHSRSFMSELDPLSQLERYAVAGGMPKYLRCLGNGPLYEALCDQVLTPDSPLWNEPRAVLAQELREPAMYFSILYHLSQGPAQASQIAAPLHQDPRSVHKYLLTLQELRLVTRHVPAGADPHSRSTQWRLTDHLMRFWYRFVFPFQADLEAGGDPMAHARTVIEPRLADHIAPVFEEVLRAWIRHAYAQEVSVAGAWWGPALHTLRMSKQRFTEEIDAIGVRGNKVMLAAEAKWTNKPMSADVLTSLDEYKLPAVRQAGLRLADPFRILLVSKAGFTPTLHDLTSKRDDVTLLSADQILQ